MKTGKAGYSQSTLPPLSIYVDNMILKHRFQHQKEIK